MAYPIFPCSRYSYSSGLAKAASPRNSNRSPFFWYPFTTGSRSSCQPSALCTFPGRSVAPSYHPPPPLNFFYRIAQLLYGFALCGFHLIFGLGYRLSEGNSQKESTGTAPSTVRGCTRTCRSGLQLALALAVAGLVTSAGGGQAVYRVKARNSAGLSSWSNFARIDK